MLRTGGLAIALVAVLWLGSAAEGARGRMAEPAGEDRRRLRTRRQRRPVRAADGGGAFRGIQAAVLRGEPPRQQRRDRLGPGRARSPTDTPCSSGPGPHLTGPAINPNIGYDPLRDFTHIAMIGADSYAWAANPALGVKSVAELVMLAKDRKVGGQNDHLVVARAGLARPSSDRAIQAQGRHRYPARARAELRHHRRPGQSHRDDAHRHDDRRRAGQGRPARGACRHLDRAQSGVQGHPDSRRAGISRRARGYLVLAVRPEGACPGRREQAQRGDPKHRKIAEDRGALPETRLAVEGPRRRRRRRHLEEYALPSSPGMLG